VLQVNKNELLINISCYAIPTRDEHALEANLTILHIGEFSLLKDVVVLKRTDCFFGWSVDDWMFNLRIHTGCGPAS
jgi:hypothetical protein